MKLRKQIVLICLFGVLQMTFISLFSQGTQNKPTRQSSMEAFSQGNYEKAYNEFRELLLIYPKDPLYKYYSGVCLVRQKKNFTEATNLLSDAMSVSGNIKTLPEDGYFFLGRAQQMSGKFNDAASSYKLYTKRVGKKVAKNLGVPGFIQECKDKKGQIADVEVKPPDIFISRNRDSLRTETPQVVTEPVNRPAPKLPAANSSLPSDYDKVLTEAIEFQAKADSVSAVAIGQKKQLDKLSGNDKLILKIKMLDNEKLAASYQSEADQKYKEAQSILSSKGGTVKPSKQVAAQPVVKPAVSTEEKVYTPVMKEAKTDPAITAPAVGLNEVYSFFEVLDHPATDPRAKVIFDPVAPAGLIYRIQIGVLKNVVSPSYFKGLSPIYGIKVAGTENTAYSAGVFRRYADASRAVSTVKTKGFKDAFIVAFMDGKPVSSDRAVLIEKEWGNKPLVLSAKNTADSKADTITPTLTFRVEIARSVKPLKEDVVEGMRKIAGNKGLDIITLEDGKTDYLVGNFITFDTASEYADLLKRNGYRDAQVVAWLGKKEIPIDLARQLFDKLK